MDFYSDKSGCSTDLVMDLDLYGEVGLPGGVGGSTSSGIPHDAQRPGPSGIGASTSDPPAQWKPVQLSGAPCGVPGVSGAPPGFGYVSSIGTLSLPQSSAPPLTAPYCYGPGLLEGHRRPGVATTYVTSSLYGMGAVPAQLDHGFPQLGRPRMSVAPDPVYGVPGLQPGVDVQDLLARRAQMDITLASLVSMVHFIYFFNTFGVAMTFSIDHSAHPV